MTDPTIPGKESDSKQPKASVPKRGRPPGIKEQRPRKKGGGRTKGAKDKQPRRIYNKRIVEFQRHIEPDLANRRPRLWVEDAALYLNTRFGITAYCHAHTADAYLDWENVKQKHWVSFKLAGSLVSATAPFETVDYLGKLLIEHAVDSERNRKKKEISYDPLREMVDFLIDKATQNKRDTQ